MDRAYEGNETRQLALDLGFIPVVPPKENRIEAWEYDREIYKRRNEVEQLFRRLKGFRRIFSRFEKLDVMFVSFISFALIADGLRLRLTGSASWAFDGTSKCATTRWIGQSLLETAQVGSNSVMGTVHAQQGTQVMSAVNPPGYLAKVVG